MVHLSVIRILCFNTVRIREFEIADLVGFRFLLDSGFKLNVADARAATEAPAARDGEVDASDAAPSSLVTAEGRLAATWAGNLGPGCRASLGEYPPPSR